MKDVIYTLICSMILGFAIVPEVLAAEEETTIIECRVYRMVASSYFEESLSAEEYPSIEVKKNKAGDWMLEVGANSAFERTEGDQVNVNADLRKGTLLVTAKTKEGDIVTLEIERRTKLAKSRLRVYEARDKSKYTVAFALCTPGFIKGINHP